MTALGWMMLLALAAGVCVALAIGRATGWGMNTNWKAPHRRHVQDYQDGDEHLTHEERVALAELEALHLHRRHPYC